MTEVGNQIARELANLRGVFCSYPSAIKAVDRVLELVEELDGSYEALRTAVLNKQPPGDEVTHER